MTCHHGGRAYEKRVYYTYMQVLAFYVSFFFNRELPRTLYLIESERFVHSKLSDIFKRRLPMGVR